MGVAWGECMCICMRASVCVCVCDKIPSSVMSSSIQYVRKNQTRSSVHNENNVTLEMIIFFSSSFFSSSLKLLCIIKVGARMHAQSRAHKSACACTHARCCRHRRNTIVADTALSVCQEID